MECQFGTSSTTETPVSEGMLYDQNGSSDAH